MTDSSTLMISEAFLQVNTVKGFRYLDDAGKIMNRWDEEFPKKDVGIHGLTMTNDTDPLREFKVTPDKIWLHFFLPKDTRFIIMQGTSLISEVCNIIGVTHSSRIGMRLQYVSKVESPDEAIGALANAFLQPRWLETISSSSDNRMLAIGFGLKDKDLRIAFRAQPVELQKGIVDEQKEVLSKHSILYDFDLYREGSSPVEDIRTFLSASAGWLSQHIDQYV